MGAWGNASFECDDVQDAIDKFRDSKAKGNNQYLVKRITLEKLTTALDKEAKRVDDNYNPTYFLGIVVEFVMAKQIPLKRHLELAIEHGTKALKDKEYIENWKSPDKRKKALRREIALLKKYL